MSTKKTVVDADNYYAYPSFEQALPVYSPGSLTSCKAVVRGNNHGYGYFAFPEAELLVIASLAATPAFSSINGFSFIDNLLFNDFLLLNLVSTALDRTVIPDIRETVVSADNYYYAFPSWIGGAIFSRTVNPPTVKIVVNADNYYDGYPTWLAVTVPLNVEFLINCCDNFSVTNENLLSQIFEIQSIFSSIIKEDFLTELGLFDSYIQDVGIFSDSVLFSLPNFYSFLHHTYGKTISDVIKPTIRSENYYAFPSWAPHEHLCLQFTLNCGESYGLINEGLISKTFKLTDDYSRLYESLFSFDLLFDGVHSSEYQLFTLESLISSLYVYPFLSFKYEKGIIDSIKPTIDADNYYAYPAWAGPEPISLSVVTSLGFTSHFQSIRKIFDVLLLALKTHYVFPTNVLNIYLALGLNPKIGGYANLMFYLPFTIHHNLQSIFDSYIKQSFSLDIFGSSIRNLNVPINLFLKHISSASSVISFSQILSSSSKVVLEGMLETIVPLSLKDNYSTEAITKGILTVTTDAAFVPIIQMVYEYSLTAPLIFSPILTTVKKSKALIKYLTIDIKKFNITINIETIERE